MKRALKISPFLLLLISKCNVYSQTNHPGPLTLKIGSKAPDDKYIGRYY